MKILLINHRYFISGGPETYMFNVKQILEQHGHEVIPFSIKSKQNVPTEYEKDFIEPIGGVDSAYFDKSKMSVKYVVETISRQFYSFKVKKQLKEFIKKEKPDVVYVLHYYNKLSVSIIDTVKEMGLPIYIRLSDFQLICPQSHMLCKREVCEDCIKKGYFSVVRNRCIKNSYIGSLIKLTAIIFHRDILNIFNKVDKFICTNEFMKEKMIESGFKSEQLEVVETPFIEKNFEYNENDIGEYILYSGRITIEKGIENLIKAYKVSDLPKNNIKLIIAGGTEKDFKKISNITLIDSIVFKGFIDKKLLNNFIYHSQYVVIPSIWYENLPNSLVEAYQNGKIVLANNIGSLKYFVENNKTGFLYKNTNDLVFIMNSLITKKDIVKNMEKKVILYSKIFSAETHYKKLITLFQGLKK